MKGSLYKQIRHQWWSHLQISGPKISNLLYFMFFFLANFYISCEKRGNNNNIIHLFKLNNYDKLLIIILNNLAITTNLMEPKLLFKVWNNLLIITCDCQLHIDFYLNALNIFVGCPLVYFELVTCLGIYLACMVDLS